MLGPGRSSNREVNVDEAWRWAMTKAMVVYRSLWSAPASRVMAPCRGRPIVGVVRGPPAGHGPKAQAAGVRDEVVFRTPAGTTFDGSGISPDVAVPVSACEGLTVGKGPGVAKALEILRAPHIPYRSPVLTFWPISFR
jgi:hypothetical protein